MRGLGRGAGYSVNHVRDVSRADGRNMILIAFLLALLGIAADGGFTDEAFKDDLPYIMDEME